MGQARPSIVNIDGALRLPGEARVSVFDRGFLYGDSVYEVVRTYRGRPFELQAHLRRLSHSAGRIGLRLPWDARRTEAELLRTLQAARGEDPPDPGAAPWNAGERYARIVMTRGAGEIGLDPALAVDPKAIVIVQPLRAPPLSAYREGVAVRVVGVEHVSPQAVDPTAKTGNYLSHVLALGEARARDGFVTEGTTSNVFVVRGGAILTPPLGAGILEGVTRGIVIGLARELGMP